MADEEREARTSTAAAGGGSPLHGCILVVEDDPSARELVEHWLAGMELRAVVLTNSVAALEAIKERRSNGDRFDGLLIDYRLPDATACRVISEFGMEFPGAPVAVMTVHNDLPLAVWARCRCIPVFLKPLDRRQLTGWLRQRVAMS